MNELADQLLEMSFSDILVLIGDVLRNPGSDPTAFGLILGSATIILVLIVLALVLLLTGVNEDDEDPYADGYETTVDPVTGEVTVGGDTVIAPVAPVIHEPQPVMVVPVDPAERARKRVIWAGIWILLLAAVWVLTGVMTRADGVCLSCHTPAGIHASRDLEGLEDPHEAVDCVSCHETPNTVASVTTRVPLRLVHFVTGAVESPWARGYDPVVSNAACAGCHGDTIGETID